MASQQVQLAYPAPGPVSAAVNTQQVFPAYNVATAPSVLVLPGSNRYNSKRFSLRMAMNYTAAGAYTVIAKLLGALAVPGTPMTYSNWTTLYTSATFTFGGAGSQHLAVDFDLYCDNVSGVLDGCTKSNVNGGTFTAAAALANPLTGVSMNAEPAAVFAASVAFGTANAGNIAYLSEFSLLF